MAMLAEDHEGRGIDWTMRAKMHGVVLGFPTVSAFGKLHMHEGEAVGILSFRSGPNYDWWT